MRLEAAEICGVAPKNRIYKSAVKKAGPTSNLAYNVIAGSMADSQLPNIITSFTDRPPSISSAQRFVTSSMKVITGDASAAN